MTSSILNWAVLATMLPAFFLGAAVKAFIPSQVVLRYLGPQASQPAAYGASVGAGVALSLCSCNVVPLFVSIWRSGAGIGPAFAFLYAGPAVNVVSLVFTGRVIGWGFALWRLAAVAFMSVVLGLVMSRVFRRGEQARRAVAVRSLAIGPPASTVAALLILLLAALVLGSVNATWPLRLALAGPMAAAVALLAVFRLERDYLCLWLRETARLLWQTVPVLVPAVLVMGWLAPRVPLSVTDRLAGENGLAVNAAAALGGALMYFPMLTEVALAQLLLKATHLGAGPAMALLLTAPGLSLPGMIVVGREVRWRKLLCYFAILVILAMVIGAFFGSKYGRYLCPCESF